MDTSEKNIQLHVLIVHCLQFEFVFYVAVHGVPLKMEISMSHFLMVIDLLCELMLFSGAAC